MPLIIGGILGRVILGNKRGAVLGAIAGYAYGRTYAPVSGYSAIFTAGGADFYTDRRGRKVYNQRHSGSGSMHGTPFGFSTEENQHDSHSPTDGALAHDDITSLQVHSDVMQGEPEGSGKVVLGVLTLAAVLKLAKVW